jgi:periplasmic mercuric ion binding protein
MKTVFVFFAISAMLSTPVLAANQTIILSVPDMSCATCPIIVKKSLTKVDGVIKAVVSLEKQSATVTFDNVRTNARILTEATSNAGYPSSVTQ